MKTKIILIALIAIASFTSQLFAQEAAAKTAGYDLKKNIKCRVSSSESGYSFAFAFNNKPSGTQAEIMANSKRQYEPVRFIREYSVSSSDNSVTEVKSPRDAASGMATGKRMHKPMTITKEIDKSTPVLYKSASSTGTTADEISEQRSGGGAGKVSMQDISITKKCAGKTTILSIVDGECDIPTGDCPNGACTLIMSWSWGATNPGSTELGSGMTEMNRGSVDFLLEIEDGVCTAMAINEKGLPGDKPRKTKQN